MWRCCGCGMMQRRVVQRTWHALRPACLLGTQCTHMSTSGPSATSPPTPQPQTEAIHTQSTNQQQQKQQQAVLTKDELLHELQCLITRPLMIGELFRRLSAPGRRALAQSKMPLEELLLHYPRHFAVYRGKSKSPRATLHVAPPHCVPYQAHVLSLPNSDATSRVPEAESVFASMQGNTTTPAQTSSSSSTYTTKSHSAQSEGEQAQSSTSNSLQVAVDFMTPQERLQIVLKYIPNEFTPYTSLSIPSWVRGKCMQYPMLTPMKYFTRHPQYFDVQAQTVGGHTFNVRRSLALQERIRMHTAK